MACYDGECHQWVEVHTVKRWRYWIRVVCLACGTKKWKRL